MSASSYPMHVDARLDSHLSRWLWLVKWVLVIPHYIVLAFLWIAFMVLSVFAFFAILFTGRYPRSIFEFNVGVLRWTWRVAYYAYGALGTDKYPPFTLHEVPDYPTHLDVEYPEHLSRGLVLVKWWLLAIPHYAIVAIFLGGGYYLVTEAGTTYWVDYRSTGLIGLLVFIAGVVLLFTGRYPQPIFDFVLGLNRWVLRVAAYAGLMTDEYPPFRFDAGPADPGWDRTEAIPGSGPSGGPGGGPGGAAVTAYAAGGPPASAPSPPAAWTRPGSTAPTTQTTEGQPPAAPPPAPPAPGAGPGAGPRAPAVRWTGGRVVALVLGCFVLLVSLAVGVGGAALGFADSQLRDPSGFFMSSQHPIASSTYAVTSQSIDLAAGEPSGSLPQGLFGDAKITARGTAGAPVFVGVARTSAVAGYLAGVEHSVVTRLPANGQAAHYRVVPGTRAPVLPMNGSFWVAKASGTGTQSIQFPVQQGAWTVVVMNADGSHGVFADVAAGATVPGLPWVVGVLLVGAGVGLVVAIVLLLIAFRTGAPRSSRPAEMTS